MRIALHALQGTILAFVTEFFADFLATDGIDELVALLKKARLCCDTKLGLSAQ